MEKVIDGDSLQVRGVGEVRLIGVDAPEWDAPFGKEASAFTRRLVEGEQVRLEYDQQRTDKYGRTLAYVHLPNGVFVNEILIQHGYGRLIKRFPFRYRDRFQRYEREAQQAGLGLWGFGRRPRPASVLGRYDDNGNGRITCAEARRHGIAPVHRGHPAYPYMHDANNDGTVCRSDRERRPPRTHPASALDRYDDNSNGHITCAEARRHGIAPVHRGHPAYPYMHDANNDGTVCR